MYRKISLIAFLLLFNIANLTAQTNKPAATDDDDDDEPQGFKRENMFLGGGLGLGFGNVNSNFGISPEIGYSLNNWVDIGIALNANYYSERADPNNYYNYNTRYRKFNIGGGPYLRIYPTPTLFLQGQLEANSIHISEKSFTSGQSASANISSVSFLAGGGYMQRSVGQSGYYMAVLLDISKAKNSPYLLNNGTMVPIIRAGYIFYLRPKK